MTNYRRRITIVWIFAVLMLIVQDVSSAECRLEWDYSADSGWIDGFAFFQNGVETGQASADLRTVTCAEANLVPGPGPITMTARRGADESPQSEPAIFDLSAPGVRIILSVP